MKMMKNNESNNIEEKLETLNEIQKINKYKKQLQLTNYMFDNEIQNFINDTINKYRYKIEVMNFYNSSSGQDEVGNQYDTLCILEKMIFQYSSIKEISSNDSN
jgi:hypothetical protein